MKIQSDLSHWPYSSFVRGSLTLEIGVLNTIKESSQQALISVTQDRFTPDRRKYSINLKRPKVKANVVFFALCGGGEGRRIQASETESKIVKVNPTLSLSLSLWGCCCSFGGLCAKPKAVFISELPWGWKTTGRCKDREEPKICLNNKNALDA